MTQTNRLQIYCDGGFGNRLNSLLSGLALAKLFELSATIYWPRNNWCQAAFSEIFSGEFHVSEQSLSNLAGTLGEAVVLLHDQLGANTLQVPFRSAYTFTSSDDFATQVLATGKDIFYYPAVIPSWLKLDLVHDSIRVCEFQPHIRNAVVNFVDSTIGRPFHGLHLRRTDLNVGYNDQEVQTILSLHSKEAFFVCSDDPIAEALAGAYPNVYRREKRSYVGKRNAEGEWTAVTADDDGRLYHSNIDRDAASVVDAVIDMLILAHSSIVGFSGSTFQTMARLYGDHTFTTAMTRPAEEIDFLSMNTATRLIRTGAMSIGEAVGQSAAMYDSGRTADAIELEKIAIEYGQANGGDHLNMYVLHHNLAVHLINMGRPYEAGLFLEKSVLLFPEREESRALLINLQKDGSLRTSR